MVREQRGGSPRKIHHDDSPITQDSFPQRTDRDDPHHVLAAAAPRVHYVLTPGFNDTLLEGKLDVKGLRELGRG